MGAHVLQVHALLLKELQGFVHILQAVDAHLAFGGPWLRNSNGLTVTPEVAAPCYQLMSSALPFILLVKLQVPRSLLTLCFLTFIYFQLYVCGGFACIYISAARACSGHRGQERALAPLELSYRLLYEHWGLDPGPLREQTALNCWDTPPAPPHTFQLLPFSKIQKVLLSSTQPGFMRTLLGLGGVGAKRQSSPMTQQTVKGVLSVHVAQY